MIKRKIAIVIGSRANYASIKSVMKEIIKQSDTLELLLFVGAAALLDKYGKVADLIAKEGFKITEKFHMLVEGEIPETMAMSVGVGLLELPAILANHKPDVVITIGDRFETLSTAIATVFMNIHLAHTMGGEVTGTIDESVRHAVTKLAHLHFSANQDAKERIIKMGEVPSFVFNTGCPRIDEVKRLIEEHRANPTIGNDFFDKYKGVGPALELKSGQFLIVMQHPVTTEYGQNREHMRNILGALSELAMPTILIWPNADAGSDEISKEIRTFREKENPQWLHAFTNLPFGVFIPLMDMAGCIVGNSSSPVREGAIIGIPTVNIGTREQGRMRGQNVLDVGYSQEEILAGIKKQLQHGKYPADYIYGNGQAGQEIVKILREIDLAKVPIQKQINY